MPSLPPVSHLLLAVLLFVVVLAVNPFKKRYTSQALKDSKVSQDPPTPSPTLSSNDSEKEKQDMTFETSLDIDQWAARQPYDAFLVLDVEATCMPGTDFNYANEIIEWPVCLLQWKHKDEQGKASRLVVVDEFRSFVKPAWRPQLSSFCTTLTGINQDDVNSAPSFSDIMSKSFKQFLVKNKLIDPDTGAHLMRFCWCSDGPWDIRDFVVKQCFISKITLPHWLSGDVMDVRRVVARYQERFDRKYKQPGTYAPISGTYLPITRQLNMLGLGAFQGRQHCGMDDTRNVARIVVELARRGMPLRPNTPINPNRRWPWMGRFGKVIEEFVTPAAATL